MSITADSQLLEPGNMVQLFELDCTALGGDTLLFHGQTNDGKITWQGKEYFPWAIAAEGFDLTGEGQQPQPTLDVGNIDGTIGALALYLDDLVGAKLTRHRTLAKYLDGMPDADPEQRFMSDAYFIERKSKHDKESLQFEMRSALDLSDVFLPRRLIVKNLCTFNYRSAECGYTGGPVADVADVATNEPSKDSCSRSVSGCKLRYVNQDLRFGGFPGAGLTRG